MKISNPSRTYFRRLLLWFPVLCCVQVHAQTAWEPADTGATTASNLLSFNAGAASIATAELPAPPAMTPPTFGSGTVYSSAPATALSGGWDLTSTGATVVYTAGVNQASAQSATDTVPGKLEFNAVTGGDLGEMKSTNMPATWNAAASITGSNSWTSVGNAYRYHFDMALNSSALSLTPGTMPNIGLLIEDGAGNDLYEANDLGELLGITDLNTQTFDDVLIDFNYDTANGPLKVTWFGSAMLSKNLVSGGSSNVMTVNDTGVFHQVAVPEISTAGLLGLTGALLATGRRRRLEPVG